MSTQILETYRALIQAVSAESSPYQEEILSALSALESGLQAHVNMLTKTVQYARLLTEGVS